MKIAFVPILVNSLPKEEQAATLNTDKDADTIYESVYFSYM